jgi:uncharacterized protein involved in type VI secretion and phage assembly
MSTLADLYGYSWSGRLYNQPDKKGIEIAEVTNLQDPQKLGRLKCRVVSGEMQDETDWCYMMTPFSGKEYGIQFMPNVGDKVVLAYVNGDPQNPIIIGSLWNKDAAMPYPLDDEGKNINYAIKTPTGIEILMNEEEDKQKFSIMTPGGIKFLMDDENQLVSISDKDEKNFIKLDIQNGKIEFAADQNMSIKAGSNEMTVDQSGKTTLGGDADTEIKGSNLTLKAQSKFAAEGLNVEVKGTASTKVQGAQTEVSGSGLMAVKGGQLALG